MKIKYEARDTQAVRKLCNIETIYRLTGGFNLDTSGLPEKYLLPPLAPLAVNFKTRTATLAIRLRIVKNGESGNRLQVAKGAPIKAGQFYSDGASTLTVKSVDTSNPDYDEITATDATTGFTTTKPVLFEANAASGNAVKTTPNYLNYDPRRVEAGATVTAIGRAYEVQLDDLYIPLTEVDQTALGDRFLFV